MRVAYIYLNSLEKKAANVVQVLNMLQGFGNNVETVHVSGYITKNKLSRMLKSYGIQKGSFKTARMPIKLVDNNILLEKTTRLIYSIFTLAYLRFSRVDTIYTRDISFLLFLSYVPRFLKPKKPIFFEPHTIYHISSQKITLNQERRALKEVNYFIPISKGIKEDLVKIFNVSEKNISVAPDGVNVDYIDSINPNPDYLNRKYGIPKSSKVVVYTGTFQDWKGVDILVKSAKYVDNENIKFLVVGGLGDDLDRINALVKEENLGSKVIVDGFLPQEEVIKILKSSHIAVLPNKVTDIGSRYSSPLKIFEYMACGLPIVCSRVPIMEEVLQEKKNCIYFEPEDARSLCNSVLNLLRNNNLLVFISTNNVNLSGNFSWLERSRDIIGVIRNVYRQKV